MKEVIDWKTHVIQLMGTMDQSLNNSLRNTQCHRVLPILHIKLPNMFIPKHI